MQVKSRPSDRVSPRDGWIAIGYVSAYVSYLFWRPENEAAHWLSMVLIPVAIAIGSQPAGSRNVASGFGSLGLRRENLGSGVGLALIAGALFTGFQVFFGGRAEAIQELIRTGRALWLFPLAFVLMMVLAGFTEEVLFRGFLQTRLEKLMRSRWAAVVGTSLFFGLYHLPYAYLNPRWPSHGDWGAAWIAALGNGVPGGLVLGILYVASRGNLLACAVLHSLINAAPAMTLLRFGGG